MQNDKIVEGYSFYDGLNEVLKQLKYDKDAFLIITGKEGTGKSYLGLFILHSWLMLTRGKVTEDDIKFVCFDDKTFKETLKIMNRYDLVIYDEAGDLDSRQTMSKKVIEIEKIFKRIRGLNYFSVFILPNLRSMTRYFKEERANIHINVSQRKGMEYVDFEVYNFNKLQEISNLLRKGYTTTNQMYKIVSPSWAFRITSYNGCLLQPYRKKKEKSMRGMLNEKDNITDNNLDSADNFINILD